MIRIIHSTDRAALENVLEARSTSLRKAELVAKRIVGDVRRHGDSALIRWTRKLDGVDLRVSGFVATRREFREARKQVSREFVRALRLAARNIRRAARAQLPKAWQIETAAGVRVGQVVRPLDRVACYVPGGRFPLPSTLLMTVIPAQVAGVREIVVASPRPGAAVLAAADIIGVEKVYRVGGAQAIAAFAFGTENVPRVDKIVGPGNRFVAAAKKLVAGECGIDFVAGPTELIIVGSRGRPQWVAAELAAQAEHDPDAVAILITPSRPFALAVRSCVGETARRLGLPVAQKSLARRGAIIVTRDLREAMDIANRFAPEHLLLLDGAASLLGRVKCAGSIFLGNYSPVAAGDYASGSNHVLPTGGGARIRGGLSVADFVKTISVQQLSRRGLEGLRTPIVELANAEGLRAHAYSVESRFDL